MMDESQEGNHNSSHPPQFAHLPCPIMTHHVNARNFHTPPRRQVKIWQSENNQGAISLGTLFAQSAQMMKTQITLAQLMLLLGAGLFYRGELIPASTVFAAYLAALIMVIRRGRDS
jgi:hypothetical protein